MEEIKWSVLEYEEKERHSDWFWILGVIIITSSLTAIIYSNYFFAILIILSGILLGIFAKKTPNLIKYTINDEGLFIDNHLYKFEHIKSFYIQKNIKNFLFIKVQKFFMPILSIPLEKDNTEKINSIMLSKNIEEEKMEESISSKIIEFFDF